LLLGRPEPFIDFKETFGHLPEPLKELFQKEGISPQGVLIGEFAGRDGAAAMIKAMEEGPGPILPIAALTGAEYGDINIYFKTWEQTRREVEKRGGKLLPLFFMAELALWHALNGRWVSLLFKAFGFYTPCIGCHTYLHLLRIPLARHLGGKIISGERVYHNGDFKVNQTELSLSWYGELAQAFGVKLLLPVKDIREGEDIKALLGMEWEQDQQQLRCVLSGNYRDCRGKPWWEPESARKYIEIFLKPVAFKILEEGYRGNFSYLQIVRGAMEELCGQFYSS